MYIAYSCLTYQCCNKVKMRIMSPLKSYQHFSVCNLQNIASLSRPKKILLSISKLFAQKENCCSLLSQFQLCHYQFKCTKLGQDKQTRVSYLL